MLRRLSLISLIPLAVVGCSSGDDGGDDPNPQICLDVTGNVDASGLEIAKPTKEVAGCEYVGIDEENAECKQIDPDLSCLGQDEPLGTPIDVTFTGCVSSFGLMAQSDDLVVTVLRDEPGVDPGYDLNGTPGMRAEKTPSAVIGRTLSVAVSQDRCIDLGHFSVENVPTETSLIVRVTDQHLDKADRTYVDTYQYNVVLRSSNIRQGPEPDATLVDDPETYCAANDCYVVDDVNTVIEQTFTTVALTAGVSQIDGDDDLYDGSGQGHVAGEVQDCTSDDTLQNVAIALSTQVRKTAYFNVGFPPSLGNLEDPKVDQSRSVTNADGLYAAIAVDTQDGGQAVDVAAAATRSVCGTDGVCRCLNGKENPAWTAPDDDGSEASTDVLGKQTVYVYPDSITILTFDRVMYTTD